MLLMPMARGMAFGTEPSKIKANLKAILRGKPYVSGITRQGKSAKLRLRRDALTVGLERRKTLVSFLCHTAEISFSFPSLIALGLKTPPLIIHWIMPVAFLPDDSLAAGWASST